MAAKYSAFLMPAQNHQDRFRSRLRWRVLEKQSKRYWRKSPLRRAIIDLQCKAAMNRHLR